MSTPCRVDFYVLARATQSPGELICRLAMMGWEQGHRVHVRTGGDEVSRELDELMWNYPQGRFLPHETGPAGPDVPVCIGARDASIGDDRDLVINLCDDPVPDPARFRRLLEIVPAESGQREASREKYKVYRGLGLSTETHKMN